jgi:hypothetical protein
MTRRVVWLGVLAVSLSLPWFVIISASEWAGRAWKRQARQDRQGGIGLACCHSLLTVACFAFLAFRSYHRADHVGHAFA